MKVLTRDFSTREIAAILVLGLVIIALAYYLVVDRPVRSGMAEAKAQQEELQEELDAVDARLAEIEEMRAEMDTLASNGHPESRMPSYNASKAELDFLNQTLSGTEDYFIGFSQVTRSGDQIRRGFSLQYRAGSYDSASKILSTLEQSEIRCLVRNLTISPVDSGGDLMNGAVTVNCTATFYETMQGGVADKELPEDAGE